MNCVVPGINLKVLGKVIQALSKVGDELYIEAKTDSLSLRTVNITKTVYATCNFHDSFFSTYTIDKNASTNSSDIGCKIPMKGILGIFKSSNHKEKKVEICKIEFDQSGTKISFKFRYKNDVTLVHVLHLIDMESLHIMYQKESTANQISAPSQCFTQVLANFPMSSDDLSVEFSQKKAIMRNYLTGDVISTRGMRSQIALNATEFNIFKIEKETAITFPIKPFRAAVHFAEFFNINITLNFEEAGRPAVVVMQNPTFEVTFVMATINGNSPTQSTSLVKKTHKNLYTGNMTLEDQQALDSVNWHSESFDLAEPVKTNKKQKKENFNDIINNFRKKRNSTNSDKNSNTCTDKLQHVFTDLSTKNNVGADNSNLNNDELTVPNSPETPEQKRTKTTFARCYEMTFHKTMIDLGEVMAANSDSDDMEMDINIM